MNLQLNRFNWISGIYDSLTALFFGKAFRDAQTFFLRTIPPESKVLVIGGGTGWILKELLTANPTCKVVYIEASSKMLEKSRRQVTVIDSRRVVFVLGTESQIDSHGNVDAVITNFFLDLFSTSLVAVMQKIKGSLANGGVWIVTDFVDNGRWWQKVMLKIMYVFFQATCAIEASRLPDYERKLNQLGIKKSKEKLFFGSFIKSALYRVSE